MIPTAVFTLGKIVTPYPTNTMMIRVCHQQYVYQSGQGGLTS